MMIRQWRLTRAEPFGSHLWFDHDSEEPSLRPLTGDEKARRIDTRVSVSGLDEDEDPRDQSTIQVYQQVDLPFI